jgi:hypothetical protein
MKTKIVYSEKILNSLSWFMRIGGITLYPWIVLREKYRDNYYYKTKKAPAVINHESIHIEQQKELLVIGFYLWYFVEWVIRLFMKGNAYKNISMEREGKGNRGNLDYLKTRKRYSFLKYINKH